MTRSKRLIVFILLFLGAGIIFYITSYPTSSKQSISVSKNEPVFEDVEQALSNYEKRLYAKFPNIKDWKRPEGPLKVGIQVGHWKNNELPDELERLRGSSLGASNGGINEWEIALVIAEKTSELLKQEGIEVEILPATVPINYWADLFIAIHADGNANQNVRGFKATGPRRDLTGQANEFVEIFYQAYAEATGFPVDPNITRNMSGYYAFNWFRNDHAIHPMTVGAILETGFITNPTERNLLVNKPEIAAEGIANAVIEFLPVKNSEYIP